MDTGAATIVPGAITAVIITTLRRHGTITAAGDGGRWLQYRRRESASAVALSLPPHSDMQQRKSPVSRDFYVVGRHIERRSFFDGIQQLIAVWSYIRGEAAHKPALLVDQEFVKVPFYLAAQYPVI